MISFFVHTSPFCRLTQIFVYTVGALKGGDFMKYVDTSVLSEVFNIKKNAVYYRKCVKVGSLPEPDLIIKKNTFGRWKLF
jgi:hypothetical protein